MRENVRVAGRYAAVDLNTLGKEDTRIDGFPLVSTKAPDSSIRSGVLSYHGLESRGNLTNIVLGPKKLRLDEGDDIYADDSEESPLCYNCSVSADVLQKPTNRVVMSVLYDFDISNNELRLQSALKIEHSH
ncbi:hypothetical protein ACJJTC_005147 [Scirpophaga incertulas]